MILVQQYSPPKTVKTLTVPKETPVEIQNNSEIRKNFLTEYSWLEGVVPAFMMILAITVLYLLYRKNI
jgi:hypothetical protein